MTGRIKHIVRDRGFGFITAEDGKDYFFHHTYVEGIGFNDLDIDEAVEFEPADSPKGPCATKVRRPDDLEPAADHAA